MSDLNREQPKKNDHSKRPEKARPVRRTAKADEAKEQQQQDPETEADLFSTSRRQPEDAALEEAETVPSPDNTETVIAPPPTANQPARPQPTQETESPAASPSPPPHANFDDDDDDSRPSLMPVQLLPPDPAELDDDHETASVPPRGNWAATTSTPDEEDDDSVPLRMPTPLLPPHHNLDDDDDETATIPPREDWLAAASPSRSTDEAESSHGPASELDDQATIPPRLEWTVPPGAAARRQPNDDDAPANQGETPSGATRRIDPEELVRPRIRGAADSETPDDDEEDSLFTDTTHLDRPPAAVQPPRQRRPKQPTTPVPAQQYRVPPPPQRPRPAASPPSPVPPKAADKAKRKPSGGCLTRMGRSLTFFLLSMLIFFMVVVGGGVILYFSIAAQLPSAEALRTRSAKFATTEIVDREGNLLWEIIDPSAGRRTTVTLGQVSQDLIDATVATEDRFFFLNVGVDPFAIVRALYYNFSEGEIVSGASTITQQLARNVLLTPEERTEQSVTRKVKEAVLAVEINRQYTKEQILEIYLNQIYYGNMAYGIEAAAQTYFGKSARDLTLAEASLLAGLPQSPAYHDPYVDFEAGKKRQADVLRLMVEAGYITPEEGQAAYDTELTLKAVNFSLEAPHFVTYVRRELEKIVPPEYIYQAGLRVQTTLDPTMQAIALEEVQRQMRVLGGRNATDGALVALDAENGQILAMVGSADFFDDSIAGQINMAITPRQVGSTVKPFIYLAGFEQKDWTPSTLWMDVSVEYPDGAGGVYRPTNYDNKFHGPVLLRDALANSFNIPAVKALERLGVDTLRQYMGRMGVTTLNRSDYGLALALGSGEVPLLQMTGAYQALANQGVRISPISIMQITDSVGRVIEPARPQPQRVISPQHAYLMSHILADNQARSFTFGRNSALNLPFSAAVKTGTTNDFRDSWTIGYTPHVVAGVWVGNADNTPMYNVSSTEGAAPIWSGFMQRAHVNMPTRQFVAPPDIVEIEVCADSGTMPGPVCPRVKRELFYIEQPPLGPENDIHQIVEIDLNSGLRANEFCQQNVDRRYYQVFPPDGREWAMRQGIPQPPEEYCPAANIVAQITSPTAGAAVQGLLSIQGVAAAANFSHYQLEVGIGSNPQAYELVHGPVRQLVEGGLLGTFDTTLAQNGPYTVRLLVYNQYGNAQEEQVRVLVNNFIPTPTPTETAAPVIIAPPTNTPLPSATFTPPPPIATPTSPPPTAIPPTAMPPTMTPLPTNTFTPLPPPPREATPTLPSAPPPTATSEPGPIGEPVEEPTLVVPPPLPPAQSSLSLQLQGGGDVTQEQLIITNQGPDLRTAGWTVEGSPVGVFALPDLFLFSDSALRLHTTRGQSSPSDLYLNRAESIWPSGTTIILRAADDSELIRITVP